MRRTRKGTESNHELNDEAAARPRPASFGESRSHPTRPPAPRLLLCCGAAALLLMTACGRAGEPESTTGSTRQETFGSGNDRHTSDRSTRLVSVPAGTELSMALDAPLNSKTSAGGDAFSATVLKAIVVEHREVIPAGSRVEGRVTEAIAARRGAGRGSLTLAFDALELTSGYRTGIVGTLQEVSDSKKKRNAAIIGGSAAGGALLGQIIGRDTRGTIIGTLIGGGVGTAVVMSRQGEQVNLPANTPFEIRLQEEIQVPHEGVRAS